MGEIKTSLLWTLKATAVFVAHFFVAYALIVLIWGGEKFFSWLYGTHLPMLFDMVPLKWLFDLIDIVVLLMFLYFGTVEAFRTFRRR